MTSIVIKTNIKPDVYSKNGEFSPEKWLWSIVCARKRGAMEKQKLNVKTPLVFVCILMASTTVTLTSCTRSKDSKMSQEVWLPWPNQPGTYTIQKVQVNTISEWAPLRGTAAQLRSHVNRIDDNFYSSQEVMMEYSHDKSGAIIPLTQFSTEVASIYAHMERFQKLDIELSIPEASIARKVYVKFIEDIGGGEILFNNAFYDATVDSFFVVPYRGARLPLSVNSAVLAHEHFHSIFARLLLIPLLKASKSKDKNIFSINEFSPHIEGFAKSVFNVFNLKAPNNRTELKMDESTASADTGRTQFMNKAILRGLNEGLADVWGWMYSADPCFMAPSFGNDVSDERCLTVEPGLLRMTGAETLGSKYSSWKNKDAQAVKYGYELGTNLARMLFLRMEERGDFANGETKKKWAQRIVNILPTFLPHMIKVYVDEQMLNSVMQWEKSVDTLLFGPGSMPVPKERCHRWALILKGKEPFENFKAQCG